MLVKIQREILGTRSPSEYGLRKVDQINDLLLLTSVFKLKNRTSLLLYIILLCETILRGTGRFRVSTSKNIMKMNLVIYTLGSQKEPPNWVTEKYLIRTL